jgi:hypothetical protein
MSKRSCKVHNRWSYRFRISMYSGLEYCRNCGTNENLSFDHIIPRAHCGSNTIDNITILCKPCNETKGAGYWELPSLQNVIPAGWIQKPVTEIKLGDYTVAGIIVAMYTRIHRRRPMVEVAESPFPRITRLNIHGGDYVWVFEAKVRELVNA